MSNSDLKCILFCLVVFAIAKVAIHYDENKTRHYIMQGVHFVSTITYKCENGILIRKETGEESGSCKNYYVSKKEAREL